MPSSLATWITEVPTGLEAEFQTVLFSGDREVLTARSRKLSARDGAIILVHLVGADGCLPRDLLVQERSVNIDTAAAGGNANLMMVG